MSEQGEQQEQTELQEQREEEQENGQEQEMIPSPDEEQSENRLTADDQDGSSPQWLSAGRQEQQRQLNRLLEQTQAKATQSGPLGSIQGLVDQLGLAVQSQRIKQGEKAQQSLQKGSTTLSAEERTDRIMGLVKDLQDFFSQEGLQGIKSNQQKVNQIITKLENTINQRQTGADRAVQESMQKAVSALAEAQAAMLARGNYSQMSQLVTQCKQRVQHIQNPYQPFN